MTANMHDMNIHGKYLYARGGFVLTHRPAHNLRAMNIAKIRRAQGLKQEELAAKTGLTQPTISRAEKGADGVTLGNFKLIAVALGVELDDLFAEDRSAVEQALILAYRELPPERKRGWLDALGLAEGRQQQAQ